MEVGATQGPHIQWKKSFKGQETIISLPRRRRRCYPRCRYRGHPRCCCCCRCPSHHHRLPRRPQPLRCGAYSIVAFLRGLVILKVMSSRTS